MERKLTKHGLRLFSNFYTSEELQKHFAHSSQRKFRVRLDPTDIGGVAYLKDGKWFDAPARDANFDGITLEAWKTEFSMIMREHQAEAELAQELRAEALRSIRANVQSRLDQLIPGAEATDADSLEKLESTVFINASWKSKEVQSPEIQRHPYGSLIASSDTQQPSGIDDEAFSDDDGSGWEVEDD